MLLLHGRAGHSGKVCYACFRADPSFAAPRMLRVLNLKSGFIFFATAVPIAALLWYLLPETKG